MEKFLKGDKNLFRIKNVTPELEHHLRELKLENHLFIESSGTGGQRKVYALSRDALLLSATDVNHLLEASESDRWMCPLPTHHIGGFSIELRAHLSNSHVDYFIKKWSPSQFYSELLEMKSTLLSLVPTQLFDLVSNNFIAPKELRAVIIGGDHLPSALAKKAIKLGWPIFHSYGMTEFCSQVATSKYSEDGIEILDNYELKIIDGLVAISSHKMFSSITLSTESGFETMPATSFCQDSFYLTKDRGIIEGNRITILGRADRLVKFKGHYLDLSKVEQTLSNILIESNLYNRAVLKYRTDERTGVKLTISCDNEAIRLAKEIEREIVEAFPILDNALHFNEIEQIQTTTLGKIHSSMT